MINTHDRLCPICSSDEKKILEQIRFTLFDGHPMNGGYALVQCGKCGFIYANTNVTQGQLDIYYTELSKYEDKVVSTGSGYSQNDRDRLFAVAKFLDQNIANKSARILDLGCANGGLLKELKNLGFENVVGVDPSHACVVMAREEVGCEVLQYSLFDIPDNIGKFDVVILSHVLEHVFDIDKAMAIVRHLLVDGGVAYIECPDAQHYYKVIHAPLQEFNSEHINHFSVNSFRNLVLSKGFEEIQIGEKVFKIASDQDYHAVYALSRKGAEVNNFAFEFDTSISKAIGNYIFESKRMFAEIADLLKEIPQDTTIALYGMGQFSFKLLSTYELAHRTKLKFFDNNKINVGNTIGRIAVQHGDELLQEYEKEKFTIVVSSLIHEMPIRNSIEARFKEKNHFPDIVGFSRVLRRTDH